jgi:uncharacterized membrane protein
VAGTKNHLSAKIQHRLALFVLVYAVCWAPNVASHIETYIAPHCWLFWLGLIQNAFSPAQGAAFYSHTLSFFALILFVGFAMSDRWSCESSHQGS